MLYIFSRHQGGKAIELSTVVNSKTKGGLHRQNTMPNIQNCVRQVGDFQPLVIIDSRTRKTKFFSPSNVSFMAKTF